MSSRLRQRSWLPHHRHYFGVVEPIDFVNFEDVEERFEQAWTALKGRK